MSTIYKIEVYDYQNKVVFNQNIKDIQELKAYAIFFKAHYEKVFIWESVELNL